ncbi:MAG TPA: Uma2 family endonuclease [Candidatus Saccharimonadales bacterium]|jgi:Uma2 family endonuclease|nr:Uma2 family endonuclease [Candidatus Saccharimonadales bacterium]
MSTTSKISFEEFQKLQAAADETVRYELDGGDLIVTPSPTPWHNIVAFRLMRALSAFVNTHDLGLTIAETDFRLPLAVRKPDVAFIPNGRVGELDLHHTPIEGAPTLAVEVISPGNSAVDVRKKLTQYLAAGAEAVWLVYPDLRLIEIHDHSGVREVTEPASLSEERLFGGIKFSLSLTALFDQNPKR